MHDYIVQKCDQQQQNSSSDFQILQLSSQLHCMQTIYS